MKLLNRLLPLLFLLYINCNRTHQVTSLPENRVHHIRQQLVKSDGSHVLVVAHRGAWRNTVKYSIPAIENAIKMGVDII